MAKNKQSNLIASVKRLIIIHRFHQQTYHKLRNRGLLSIIFLETLHISKTEPQLNVNDQSLPLYLFNA